MKKILIVIVVLICLFSTSVLQPKAKQDGYSIDTSSKQSALSSIVQIFVNWQNQYPNTYQNIYGTIAHKLYLFAKDLNQSNVWNSSTITAAATNRGISIAPHVATTLYTSVTLYKDHAYETVRTDLRDNPNYQANFNSDNISKYQNYIGLEAFDSSKEYFNIIITTTITTSGDGGDVHINSIGNETITQTYTYGAFRRLFAENQANYGFSSSYNPKYTFTYPSKQVFPTSIFLADEMEVTLIDDDKLYINFMYHDGYIYNEVKIYITKEQHYLRNYYDEVIEPNYWSTFFAVLFSTFNCYYHQLANYDLDNSNENNYKLILKTSDAASFNNTYYYYPFASFERVYDENNNVVSNPLVKGTFNFIDPSVCNELHWAYDVVPYIIWGNSALDNSSVGERLIWESNDIYHQNAKFRRGTNLISNYNCRFGTETYNNLTSILGGIS